MNLLVCLHINVIDHAPKVLIFYNYKLIYKKDAGCFSKILQLRVLQYSCEAYINPSVMVI
jgi:hypothetical protein